MLLVHKENDRVKIVKFPPETIKLNILNASDIKIQLNKLIDENCKNLIIDFSGVMFIDSTGFGSLVTVFQHAKNKYSKLILCNISKETMQLVKITKLDQVFEIYEDI